ncbi:hypothetical protein RB195_023238 [Necator americanus]|uniref:Oxidoreductase, short chain dehydrogenase/reductase family protein n=1 Tax=Necator americanus TaxID=51031 RepID=A0ABR1EIC8_NECAM
MSQILAVEKGAKLIVIDIDSKGAEGTARSILDGGGQAKAYHCDIRDEHEMERIAHRIHEDYGKVDIVLCNAAVLSFAPFMELTTRELLQSLEVNVIGTINTIRAFLKPMMERNSGQVVAVSSVAGFSGETFGLAYCS